MLLDPSSDVQRQCRDPALQAAMKAILGDADPRAALQRVLASNPGFRSFADAVLVAVGASTRDEDGNIHFINNSK